jgi:ATP-dependent Lon protease
VAVTPKNLDKFSACAYRFGMAEKENQVGQVTGLAWTEVGGELLTIEAVRCRARARPPTGKLGDVMQESIQAAMTVVRSRASRRSASPDFYEKSDIHIHVPEGATPKDGPSARASACAPRWCRC